MLITVVYASDEATSNPRESRTVGMKTVMVTCAPNVIAETTQMTRVRRASSPSKISASRTRCRGSRESSVTVTQAVTYMSFDARSRSRLGG